MGACCSSQSYTLGDQYLYKNLNSMNLWNVTYQELVKELISEASKTRLIYFEKVKKMKIFNSLSDLQEYFLNLVFLSIEKEPCSIYQICFRLFSFLSLGEDAGSDFYDLCFRLNGETSLTLSDYKERIIEFYKFSLIFTNQNIMSYLNRSNDFPEKKQIIQDLKLSESKYFKESNIENEISSFIQGLKDINKDLEAEQIKKYTSQKLYFRNLEIRSHFQITYNDFNQ